MLLLTHLQDTALQALISYADVLNVLQDMGGVSGIHVLQNPVGLSSGYAVVQAGTCRSRRRQRPLAQRLDRDQVLETRYTPAARRCRLVALLARQGRSRRVHPAGCWPCQSICRVSMRATCLNQCT